MDRSKWGAASRKFCKRQVRGTRRLYVQRRRNSFPRLAPGPVRPKQNSVMSTAAALNGPREDIGRGDEAQLVCAEGQYPARERSPRPRKDSRARNLTLHRVHFRPRTCCGRASTASTARYRLRPTRRHAGPSCKAVRGCSWKGAAGAPSTASTAQSRHSPSNSTICRCGAKPARAAVSRSKWSSPTSSISSLRPHFSHSSKTPWCA
jgi:hypothetical protein